MAIAPRIAKKHKFIFYKQQNADATIHRYEQLFTHYIHIKRYNIYYQNDRYYSTTSKDMLLF